MMSTHESSPIPKRRIKKAIAIGLVTIGVPFLFKIFTIYTLLSPGGQGDLRDVFFYAIVALNFLCLLCIGIIWTADLRDVAVENRIIKKAKSKGRSLEETYANKDTLGDVKKQAKVKWIALVSSILNTLSSIGIAAIIYTQEKTVFNIMMIVLSVVTIFFDFQSLYAIFKFYQRAPDLKRSSSMKKLEKKFIRSQGKDKMSKEPKLKALAPLAQTALSATASIK